MKSQLSVGFPIVHIASHFVLQAGSDQSYLLLGAEDPGHPGSNRLTYDEIKNSPSYNFTDVELMTLSACDTGISGGPDGGKEIDALGDLAESNGARAVIATLWDVNDASTGKFMTEFYRRWTQKEHVLKVEALSQTQTSMLHTGDEDAEQVTCKASLKHPYYWAPFVLIGNWQ